MRLHLLVVLGLSLSVGCGESPDSTSNGGGGFGSYGEIPETPADATPDKPEREFGNVPLPEFPLPDPNEPPSVVVVDDCVQGSRLRDSQYELSRSFAVLPNAKLKILLEIQIVDAINKYWGFNGEYPKDFETFKRDCIDANNLQLPLLKPGYEYWFDSESGVLMKRPAPVAEGTDETTEPETTGPAASE